LTGRSRSSQAPAEVIGRGLVDGLIMAGATVAAGVRDEVSFDELSNAGPGITPYTLDVTDVAGIATTVDQVVSDHGALDIVVANAGLGDNHPFVDGNKRVGFAAADVFLRLNGHVLMLDDAEAHAFIVDWLRSTSRTLDSIDEWFREGVTR
jgi:short-subunit dehydrogenase involved in D-alanine esterification of teichoic acids